MTILLQIISTFALIVLIIYGGCCAVEGRILR